MCLPSVWKAFWGAEEEQGKAAEELQESLRFLEQELEGKRFFGEEKAGFVDIVANFIAHWLGAIQEAAGKEVFTKEKYPGLFEWAHEFVSFCIIEETLPPKEGLVAFYKAHIAAAVVCKQFDANDYVVWLLRNVTW